MMTVAIDASRAAEERKTGVGWYAHHLIAALRQVIPHDVRVVLYSDQPLPAELHPLPARWEEALLWWPPRPLRRESTSIRWPLWSQVRLAWQVLSDRPDVLFVPAHVIPDALGWLRRLGLLRTQLVTTIHDVAFRTHPETYSRRERWYADRATRLAMRTADRIIVPTEAIRRDLEPWYGMEPERIAVVYHGVESGIRNQESGNSAFRLPHSVFLLYVGRLEHKKNVARIVEAFGRIAARHPDLALVLAGPPGHGSEEIAVAIARSPVRARIHTPGWVDAATYRGLLGDATAFIFPTLAEGFGLPILEAMAAGVPVVTSRGGAHGEVAGDAALLVDPLDVDAIAAGIERVLGTPGLRDDLVRRGRQRAAAFTWDRTAEQTWTVLRSVLSV